MLVTSKKVLNWVIEGQFTIRSKIKKSRKPLKLSILIFIYQELKSKSLRFTLNDPKLNRK